MSNASLRHSYHPMIEYLALQGRAVVAVEAVPPSGCNGGSIPCALGRGAMVGITAVVASSASTLISLRLHPLIMLAKTRLMIKYFICTSSLCLSPGFPIEPSQRHVEQNSSKKRQSCQYTKNTLKLRVFFTIYMYLSCIYIGYYCDKTVHSLAEKGCDTEVVVEGENCPISVIMPFRSTRKHRAPIIGRPEPFWIKAT